MVITLPEPLQKEAEALAKQEGIDVTTLVIRAVQQLIHDYQRPLSLQANEARQRLLEFHQHKLNRGSDLVAEARKARVWATKQYRGEEELTQSQLRQLAEQSPDYLIEDADDKDESLPR